MLTIPKIRAAAFAIRKHFSFTPYKLLHNPKGMSGANVRMIKYEETLDEFTLDTAHTYTRITKDFSNPNPNVSKEKLEVNRYNFFDDSNVRTDQKKISKYTRLNSESSEVANIESNNISQETISKRDFTPIHKKRFKIIEVVPDMSSISNIRPYPQTVTRLKSYAEMVTETYYQPTFSKAYNALIERLSFWKTLYHNLKQ